MAWEERTVRCPECKAERTTRAGTGTALGCPSCGTKFRAPADPPAPPAKTTAPRVKRAQASATVVRKATRPKKASPTAGDGGKPPADPAKPDRPPTQSTKPAAGGGASPPPAPPVTPAAVVEPASPLGEPGGRRRQVAAGRRGGLAYYGRWRKREADADAA